MARTDGPKTDGRKFPVKGFVIFLLIVVVAAFAIWQNSKGRLVTLENQAVGHQNAAQYDEAICVYDELLPKLGSNADKARVRRQLAVCWKAKGDNPSLPLKQQIEYYKKALEYDPGCITNKVTLDAIKRSR